MFAHVAAYWQRLGNPLTSPPESRVLMSSKSVIHNVSPAKMAIIKCTRTISYINVTVGSVTKISDDILATRSRTTYNLY